MRDRFGLRWGLLSALIGVGAVMRVTAQDASGAEAKAPPAYDVASIRADKTGSGSVHVDINNDQFRGTNVTLKMLMEYAWGLKAEEQVAGLPPWASSARYDLEAKVDAEAIATLKAMTPEQRNLASGRMMQELLEDRFQMKVHHEQRELPVYALLAAKGGTKLKEADPNGDDHGMHTNNQKLIATATTMESLTQYLAQRLHRMVVDRTGLKGKYDFTLQWSPDEAIEASEFPPLFTAIQEQLGLRLEAGKGMVDTIVVDHIEQPTEN